MNIKLFLFSFFVYLFFGVSLFAQIPTKGLIAYYPFNGNVNDESGNGNNGILIHGATLTTDRCGNPNKAFYFNGISDYIQIPSKNLNGLNEYSYSLWIYPSAIPATVGGIAYCVGETGELTGGSGTCQALTYQDGTKLFAGSYNVGQNPAESASLSGKYEPKQWIHVVVTRDFYKIKMYVNGILIKSEFNDLINNQLADYGSGDKRAIIGGRGNLSSENFFYGKIDDVALYNRVLDSTEVKSLYRTNCIQIIGDQNVCPGQLNVNFSATSFNDSSSRYSWKYSGTNVGFSGESNRILANFANNATSGVLSVTVSGDSLITQTTEIPITVNRIPSKAGIITGEKEVCANQSSVNYSVPLIDNATNYTWNYSGTGVVINKTSNNINIDFSQNATSGLLTVSGINNCGSGDTSSTVIHINSLPSSAGGIIGPDEVCLNQGKITYAIPKIDNSSSYVWNYSGSGASIVGSADSVKIYFFNDAKSGNLSVYGVNNCGDGPKSENFPIIVKSCSENISNLNIPNAFSPNGDGINDLFVIKGLPENSRLMIFDRLGKELYKSDNYKNDWTGKDDEGHVLDTGTYWYILSLSGIQNEFKGFVYLKK